MQMLIMSKSLVIISMTAISVAIMSMAIMFGWWAINSTGAAECLKKVMTPRI